MRSNMEYNVAACGVDPAVQQPRCRVTVSWIARLFTAELHFRLFATSARKAGTPQYSTSHVWTENILNEATQTEGRLSHNTGQAAFVKASLATGTVNKAPPSIPIGTSPT